MHLPEIDSIIKNLNHKITVQGVGVDKLDSEALTATERAFMHLYQPQRALIIYGTLAPGRPNHSKIEHIKGTWTQGVIKGKLVKEGWAAELGYFGFKHATPDEQESIEAYVLFSDELTDNWAFLDAFEGNGYRRILAKFELANGDVGVGNIYAINDASI